MVDNSTIDRFNLIQPNFNEIIDQYEFMSENQSDQIIGVINQFKLKLSKEFDEKANNDKIILINDNVVYFTELGPIISILLFDFHPKNEKQKLTYYYLRSLSLYLFQIAYNYTGDYLESAIITLNEVSKQNKSLFFDYYLEMLFLADLQHYTAKLLSYYFKLNTNSTHGQNLEFEKIDTKIIIDNPSLISNLYLISKNVNPLIFSSDINPKFKNLYLKLISSPGNINKEVKNMDHDKKLMGEYIRNSRYNLFSLLENQPEFVFASNSKPIRNVEEVPVKFFKSRISIQFRTNSEENLRIFTYLLVNILGQFGSLDHNLSFERLFMGTHKIEIENIDNDIYFSFQPRSVKTKVTGEVFAQQFYLVNFELRKFGSLFRNFKNLVRYMPELYSRVKIRINHFAIQLPKSDELKELYNSACIYIGDYPRIITSDYFYKPKVTKNFPVKITLLKSGYLQFHMSKSICRQIDKEILNHENPKSYLLDLARDHAVNTLTRWLDVIDMNSFAVIDYVKSQFTRSKELEEERLQYNT